MMQLVKTDTNCGFSLDFEHKNGKLYVGDSIQWLKIMKEENRLEEGKINS